jgi:hypothetical protein
MLNQMLVADGSIVRLSPRDWVNANFNEMERHLDNVREKNARRDRSRRVF